MRLRPRPLTNRFIFEKKFLPTAKLYYNIQDLSTLYQEADGDPAAGDPNDPVGLIDNLAPNVLKNAVSMTGASSGSNGIQVADDDNIDFGTGDFTLPLKFSYNPGGENLLTFAEEFDNAAWAKIGCTISADAIAAPNGTTTADTLVEDTSTGQHYITNNYFTSSPGVYSFSFYAKATASGRYAFAQITMRDPTSRRYGVTVDLSTGSVLVTGSLAGPTDPSNTVTDEGGGFYRITLTSTASSGITQVSAYIGASNSATLDANAFPTSYTGDGTSGIYVWGAQLETGSTATAYTKTTSSPVLKWLYKKYQDASNYWGFRLGSDNKLRFKAVVAGTTELDITSTAAISATVGDVIEGAFSCVRETASAAGSSDFYIDGAAVGASVAITAGAPTSIDNTGALYINGSSTSRNLSDVYHAHTFNRALSAAEVLDLSINGIADADKWGSQTPVYSSDFSVNTDSWSDFNGTSVVGNIDSIGGLNDWLRVTMDGTTGNHSIRRTSLLTIGVQYRASFKYYIPPGQSNVDGLLFSSAGYSSGTLSALGAVTEVILEFTPTGTSMFFSGTDGGATSFTDAGADDVFYIKDFVLTKIGATLALEPEGLDGTATWADSSGNSLDGTLPASGATVVQVSRPAAKANAVTNSLRPLLKQDGNSKYYLDFDGVDDALVANPGNLGSDCMVAYVNASGVTILTSQTITGRYTLPANDWYGIVVTDYTPSQAAQNVVKSFLLRESGV